MSKLPPQFPPAPNWIKLLNPMAPFYGDKKIEDLYLTLFSNVYFYRAYYDPRFIPGLADAFQAVGLAPDAKSLSSVKPMTLTLAAANEAARSGLVKQYEQALVHLAAIVSPCGLLMATHDLDHQEKSATPSWDEIESVRTSMLSRPLLKVKSADVAMGNTLAALLGQTYEEDDVDIDQVTRLAAAVRLSDIKVASFWTGYITTAPHKRLLN